MGAIGKRDMGRKLLVVEDDPVLSRGAVTFGERAGWTVVVANRGDVAVELVAANKPDVILLDMMLPGLDGRDVLARLRNEDLLGESKVFFLSARDSASDRVIADSLGATGYFVKPIGLPTLFDELDKFVPALPQ